VLSKKDLEQRNRNTQVMIKAKVADWTTEINHHGSFDTLLRITNNSLHFTVWKQLSTRQPARSMTNNAGTTSKGVTRNNGTDRRFSVPAYLYVNYKRRVVWQCTINKAPNQLRQLQG